MTTFNKKYGKNSGTIFSPIGAQETLHFQLIFDGFIGQNNGFQLTLTDFDGMQREN
jgi:hypothetical protein